MTVKTIYPVEHSQFEKRFGLGMANAITPGQTAFTLDVAGPFTAHQVCYNRGKQFAPAIEGQTVFELGYAPTTLFADPYNTCVVVYLNDEIKLPDGSPDSGVEGDYSLDSATGTITFHTPLAEDDDVRTLDTYYWYYPLVSENYTLDDGELTWTGPTLSADDQLFIQSYFAPIRFAKQSGAAFVDASGVIAKNAGFVSVLVNGVQKRPDVIGEQRDYSITSSTITFHSAPGINALVVALFGDFDLLQETVDASADGDEIAISDTDLSTQAGVAKKLAFQRMKLCAANIVTPSGTYEFYSLPTAEILRNPQAYQVLLVDKGIKFCKTETGGKPTITEYPLQANWDHYFPLSELGSPWASFIVHGNVEASISKRPKFENIKFERQLLGMFATAPVVVDHCDFDYMYESVIPMPDNRITFKHLSSDPNNFSDPMTTEITNCTFEHSYWAAINVCGSCVTFAHNTIQDYLGWYCVVQFNPSIGAGWWSGHIASTLGFTEDSIMSRHNSFNLIDDCDVIGTPGVTPWYVALNGEAVGAGAKSVHNSIKECRFTDWSCIQCTEAGWAYDMGVSQDNEIVDCEFTRCSGCTVIDSYLGDDSDPALVKVERSLIHGNTFVDCSSVPSLLWTPSLFPPDGGPAVLLRYARHCTVSGNNYVASGLVTAAVAKQHGEKNDVPILLINADHCVISENKNLFPTSGPKAVKPWVIDENGYDNWIGKSEKTQGDCRRHEQRSRERPSKRQHHNRTSIHRSR